MDWNSINWTAALAVFLIMTAASAVHGSIGYGVNIMAGPLVVMFEPRLAPGPLLVAGFVLTLMVLLREGRHLDLRGLSWMLGGRVIGTIAATMALALLTGRATALVFGTLVLLAVWMSLTGRRFPPTSPVKFTAGILSGVMGTLAAIGGPPAALVYQDTHGSELRSTLSGFFVFGSLFSLAALVSIGKFGLPELSMSLGVLPGVLAGYLLSPLLIRSLDRNRTRITVLTVSGLAGAVLIIQNLAG